ncbi:MAG: Uma2 family endonuclease [Microscillaceae bacterium]|jgi:Uma2 family endonuclease|nr:Uma2 family endonuclease [Microscillaceae bacterium]
MLANFSKEFYAEFLSENGDHPEAEKPRVATSTQQFEWIVFLKNNLDNYFQNRTNVTVAACLWWYPMENNPKLRIMPDVMVSFGRPKKARDAYRQWEEADTPPQVVFEMISANNTVREMRRKWRFYQEFGVEEYYIYDPEDNDLRVWTREADRLAEREVEPEWTSPLLQIRFVLAGKSLKIFDLYGEPFLSFADLMQTLQSQRRIAEAEKNAREVAEERLETELIAKQAILEREEQIKRAKEAALQREEEERQAKITAIKKAEEARLDAQKNLTDKQTQIDFLRELLRKNGVTVR